MTMQESISGTRILLAEDNSVVSQFLVHVLQQWGGTVFCVETGAAALQILQQERIDIILMDLQMPVMDGFQAARSIRSHADKNICNLPIIALTATDPARIEDRVREAGMDDCIAKPVQSPILLSALHRVLYRNASGECNALRVTENGRVVDHRINQSYLNELTAGDEEFRERTIRLCIQHVEDFIEETGSAMLNNEWRRIGELSHTLIPVFRMLGLLPEAITLGRIEDAIRDNVFTTLSADVESMREVAKKLSVELRSLS